MTIENVATDDFKESKKDAKGGVESKHWDSYIKEAKGLERNYLTEILKSRKKAHFLAWLGAGFGVFMLFWHQFNPLTITAPYVLRVDNSTGAVDVVSEVKTTAKTYGEVEDRYWIANYIRHYENYGYQTIQFDYDSTLVSSSPDVAKGYKAIYGSDVAGAPPARDKVLGMAGTRLVKIVSITPDTIKGIAVVRFQTQTSGQVMPESWIATMSYEYSKATISDSVRLLNPLGFLVTSYRVEKENI